MPLAPRRLSTEPLDDDVDSQPVEPGAKGRLATEARELLPHPHKNILRQLIGLTARRHPPDDGVHARQMRVVEPLEGPDVATCGKRHIVCREDGL